MDNVKFFLDNLNNTKRYVDNFLRQKKSPCALHTELCLQSEGLTLCVKPFKMEFCIIYCNFVICFIALIIIYIVAVLYLFILSQFYQIDVMNFIVFSLLPLIPFDIIKVIIVCSIKQKLKEGLFL